MTNILFVCHGNICRSPMAEFIFQKIARENGCAGQFEVASAAVSREELGNPIYPPAQTELRRHGIPFDTAHRARQMTAADYAHYDLLIGMDAGNLYRMQRIVGGDPQRKMHKLMDYVHGGDVADPWMTGGFDEAYRDIDEGCRALLDALTK